jgi:hypothetical protein
MFFEYETDYFVRLDQINWAHFGETEGGEPLVRFSISGDCDEGFYHAYGNKAIALKEAITSKLAKL